MDDSVVAPMFRLEGKVAAITGAGGALCGTMAKALGQAGVTVALLDIREDAAQVVADEIQHEGGKALALKTDVLDREGLGAVQERVLEEFGRVDFLINGAGGNQPKATTSEDLSFFDLTEEALRFCLDLNFLGTLFPCQIFGRHFADRGVGTIVNIASMAGIRPLTKGVAYSAAKGAVANFTQWLAVHMSNNYSKRIRVNAIAPGFFITAQNRYLLWDDEKDKATDRGQTVLAHTPLARFGKPEDLVGTLFWLLSPGAEFVHGTVIPVDGGFAAFGGV